jgi:hypothetical protein
MNKLSNLYLFTFLTLLLISSCGSTDLIIQPDGEVHVPGFFTGFFSGILLPISLIFMGIGAIIPSFSDWWYGSGGSTFYYHFNTGFGYWLGFCIGVLPYLAILFGGKAKKKNNSEQSENEK